MTDELTRPKTETSQRLELECYATYTRPPEIVPGRPQRGWMDSFHDRHPYRCLPLSMANSTGWEILCPMGFTAEWNGGVYTQDITIWPDHPHADFHEFVKSHFSHGVLTFHTGYLFKTPPGWSMWVMGAPNHIKDGVQALSGLVETDWLPFPFTMNWKFTRPGRIRFEKGEPFCFITLAQDKPLESFEVSRKVLESDEDLRDQYMAWHKQREGFNARLAKGDPTTVKEAWQRFYFKGEMPEAAGPAPKTHVNKRRLKPPRLVR
jgi:Family of unknown function (DUF6065)